MLRPTLSSLALAASLALCVACGGAQKHAESPDPTESGWSGASNDGAQAKADPPIQSSAASGDSAAAAKSAPSGDKADKQIGLPPQTSSAAEADVVSGNSLPPSLRAGGAPSTDASATSTSGTGRKPSKAKKPGKRKKKSAS